MMMGFMMKPLMPMAAALSDQDIKLLARYYASLKGLETTLVE